jgi:hypothetical protein
MVESKLEIIGEFQQEKAQPNNNQEEWNENKEVEELE